MCRKPVGEGAKRVTTGSTESACAQARFPLLSIAAMQWTSAPNIGEAPLPQRARRLLEDAISALREGWKAPRGASARSFRLGSWSASARHRGLVRARDQPVRWAALPVPVAPAWPSAGLRSLGGRAGRAWAGSGLAMALGCAPGLGAGRHGSPRPRLERPLVTDVRPPRSSGSTTGRQGRPAADPRVLPMTARLPPRVRVSVESDKARLRHRRRGAESG